MLVRRPEGEYETIDFREKAPMLSNETMYVQNINLSLYGGLAIGVPGELAGIPANILLTVCFWQLHQRHGKLNWSTLFQPSIQLAAGGFKVPYTLASIMRESGNEFLTTDPTFRAVFAPNGTLLNENDTMYRPT
jgi:gamma-glutamyltranspeptidase / glutathione hydrolase